LSGGLNKLSAVAVRNASVGMHGDGGGLWLIKREDGGAQWVQRVSVHGRRREMGLGGLKDVSLAQARDMANKCRALAKRGIDPIKERQKQRREAERNMHLLRDVAVDAFESRKAELKGDGKAGSWFSPLELHILPKLGAVPISQIDQIDIRDTLKPIWHTKASTAQKAIDRLNIVMKHAAALGLDVDMQAVEKAKALLGKTRHVPKNIEALTWQEVPAFFATLAEPTVTHLALRLLILTGLRSAPIRFLREDHIEGDVLTVPADLMKGRRGAVDDFRVPLSDEALAVISEVRRHARDGFLFPSVRKGVISDATMSRLMQRRGMDARPHGFRSSLRTWIAETTEAPHEVAEAMLAHITGNKVERSYRRTDFLEQRRVLLDRWAEHVTGGSDKLVRLQA
jgi:integrase